MFARHYLRNLGWFLFLELLRCFSSLGSPPSPYIFRSGYPCGWVSPFGHLRIKAYLPAPRSFSQAITSFVAYHCQGIHHMLLFTWPYNFDFFCKNSLFLGLGMFWQVFHLSRYAVIVFHKWLIVSSFAALKLSISLFLSISNSISFEFEYSFWRNQNFTFINCSTRYY